MLCRARAPVCLLCKFIFNNPIGREFFWQPASFVHITLIAVCQLLSGSFGGPWRLFLFFWFHSKAFDGFWLLLKVINGDEFVSGASAVAIWTHQPAGSWLIALNCYLKSSQKKSRSCRSCNAKKLGLFKILIWKRGTEFMMDLSLNLHFV